MANIYEWFCYIKLSAEFLKLWRERFLSFLRTFYFRSRYWTPWLIQFTKHFLSINYCVLMAWWGSCDEDVCDSLPAPLRDFTCEANRGNRNHRGTGCRQDKVQFSGTGIGENFVCDYCILYELFILKKWTYNRTSNAKSMKNN